MFVYNTGMIDLLLTGLFIYNANIAEMNDLDVNNRYFTNLKQKALEGASTEARIQVWNVFLVLYFGTVLA